MHELALSGCVRPGRLIEVQERPLWKTEVGRKVQSIFPIDTAVGAQVVVKEHRATMPAFVCQRSQRECVTCLLGAAVYSASTAESSNTPLVCSEDLQWEDFSATVASSSAAFGSTRGADWLRQLRLSVGVRFQWQDVSADAALDDRRSRAMDTFRVGAALGTFSGRPSP